MWQAPLAVSSLDPMAQGHTVLPPYGSGLGRERAVFPRYYRSRPPPPHSHGFRRRSRATSNFAKACSYQRCAARLWEVASIRRIDESRAFISASKLRPPLYERPICYLCRLGAYCWRKSGINDNLDRYFRGRLRMLPLFSSPKLNGNGEKVCFGHWLGRTRTLLRQACCAYPWRLASLDAS